MQPVHPLRQLLTGDRRDQFAVLEHVMAIRQRRCKPEVLFDENDGVAASFELGDDFTQTLDDHRSKSFRDFIQ